MAREEAGTAEPTLSTRELNRALLARQGLLDGHAGDVPTVLDRVGGIQAQYAPAMYVGLLARMRSMARGDVTTALERRTAVQGTLLRSTIHLVSRADYWPTVLGIRRTRRQLHLRALQNDPPEEVWRSAADRLRAALARGPLRRKEIDDLIGSRLRGGINVWLDLVRVPPSGTWERRSADVFGLAEDWVGPESGSEEAGIAFLVTRYLEAFGPAHPGDIASWAGLPVGPVTAALAGVRTRQFRDEAGKTLYDLPDAALPPPDVPAPVRFLPTWDATLLVHARRTLVLPEAYRTRVFHIKNPHSVNTFLVDGAVAGTWRYADGRVTTEEFAPLDPADRRAVAAEAERVAAFHA